MRHQLHVELHHSGGRISLGPRAHHPGGRGDDGAGIAHSHRRICAAQIRHRPDPGGQRLSVHPRVAGVRFQRHTGVSGADPGGHQHLGGQHLRDGAVQGPDHSGQHHRYRVYGSQRGGIFADLRREDERHPHHGGRSESVPRRGQRPVWAEVRRHHHAADRPGQYVQRQPVCGQHQHHRYQAHGQHLSVRGSK